MPLLLLPWIGGAALGFGGGFLASDGMGKLVKLSLIVGGGFVAYQYYRANA